MEPLFILRDLSDLPEAPGNGAHVSQPALEVTQFLKRQGRVSEQVASDQNRSVGRIVHATGAGALAQPCAIARTQPNADVITLAWLAPLGLTARINWIARQHRVDDEPQELRLGQPAARRERAEARFDLDAGPGGDLA